MTLSILLTCGWFILANVLAMMPSKRRHWPQAWGLITIGIPILGYVVYEHGPWLGLLVLAGAMSMLRWPVIYLFRWMRKLVR
ncbi:DUF2484 family protein [Thalassobius sp. MITS945101]|uniref:DUF2484 family protein n=1 Tax=Thalassobius sp. MITS945101 TaxID=3096994 RepID=UPI00399B980D